LFHNRYTSIDLFAGPGGLTTGIKLAGIKPLIAVEINSETVETYAANQNAEVLDLEKYLNKECSYEELFFPNEKTILIKGDIKRVSNNLIEKILTERFLTDTVDIVTGGPPCESFSIAGKRIENDERDFLFVNMSRIAKAVDASMLLFENVKGLLSKKKSEGKSSMFQEICEEFEIPDSANGVSFRIDSWQKNDILLNCAHYGVPQNRERVFLVGINTKHSDAYFTYPKKTNGDSNNLPFITVEEALGDLPVVNVEEEVQSHELSETYINSIKSLSHKRYLKFIRGIEPENHNVKSPTSLDSHRASKHFPKIIKRMSLILPGESMKTAAARLILEGNQNLREEYFPEKPYGARYRRLKSNAPSFTVTSHSFDEMIHPKLNRALTPREAARLQTFPDWYVFKGPYVIFHSNPKQDRYEQIGDAVPPLMGYRLGEEIVNTLNTIKGKS
jgi:DNA (cytosine-5)-methyltransferase 1